MKYKNHLIKPADNFNKAFLIYKLINGNQRFVKGVSSIEQAKSFIDKNKILPDNATSSSSSDKSNNKANS